MNVDLGVEEEPTSEQASNTASPGFSAPTSRSWLLGAEVPSAVGSKAPGGEQSTAAQEAPGWLRTRPTATAAASALSRDDARLAHLRAITLTLGLLAAALLPRARPVQRILASGHHRRKRASQRVSATVAKVDGWPTGESRGKRPKFQWPASPLVLVSLAGSARAFTDQ